MKVCRSLQEEIVYGECFFLSMKFGNTYLVYVGAKIVNV